jgi:hypothetical protein
MYICVPTHNLVCENVAYSQFFSPVQMAPTFRIADFCVANECSRVTTEFPLFPVATTGYPAEQPPSANSRIESEGMVKFKGLTGAINR